MLHERGDKLKKLTDMYAVNVWKGSELSIESHLTTKDNLTELEALMRDQLK